MAERLIEDDPPSEEDIFVDEAVPGTSQHQPFGKSPVYRYFLVKKEEDLIAKCLVCGDKVTRGTKTSKTTSSMWYHLQSQHKEKYELIKPKEIKSSQKSLSQPTLQQVFENQKKWDIDDEKSQPLHYRIGKMITMDNQPFSIVEDSGFRRLMELAKPRYTVSLYSLVHSLQGLICFKRKFLPH